MEKDIFEKVVTIIKDCVQQQKLNISLNSSSSDVEGWDSLRHMMIITEVEKAFGIKIDFMQILEIKTVGDICSTVSKSK